MNILRWLVFGSVLAFALSVDAGVLHRAPTGATAADKVSPDVRAEVAKNGRARVNITLSAVPAAEPGRFSRPDLFGQVSAAQDEVLARVSRSDFSAVYRYEALPALSGFVSQSGLMELEADPTVSAVTLDGAGSGATGEPLSRTIRPSTLAHSVPMIRADLVHAEGITGTGVTVAILDSGADTSHPDLAAAISGQECFLTGPGSLCPNGTTRQSGAGAAEDDLGHGSNVAGIVASRGVVSSVGVAPGASIMLYKVLNSSNRGQLSDWDAALNDIIAHHPEVRVINMSLVTLATFGVACGSVDPTTTIAFNTLNAADVSIFVSSGNNGAKSSMTYPACVPGAVSVGAVYEQNYASSTFFSCTDAPATMDVPTCWSNSQSTLDLLAPGAFIVSDGLNGGLSTYGGTSQAAPHAAGVAALMLQKAPALKLGNLLSGLEATGVPRTDPANGITTPRIDAYGAVNAAVSVGGIAEAPEIGSGAGSARESGRGPWQNALVLVAGVSAIALAIGVRRRRRHA